MRRGDFLRNPSVPHPVWVLLKIPRHLVQLLATRILIPNTDMKIYRTVRKGKMWGICTELKSRDDILQYYCCEVKSMFKWNLPLHATHWLAILWSGAAADGLTKISLKKSRFNPPACNRIVSLAAAFGRDGPEGIFRAISNSADIWKRLFLVMNERK